MFPFPMTIMAIADEDEREFMKRLYVTYHVTMYKMAMSTVKISADADDVVSDAVLSLMRNFSVIRDLNRNVLEGYVISTVKNAAYMRLRKRKRRNEVELSDELLATIPREGFIEENIMEECTIQELMEGISQLPDMDQVVLRLKYFEKRKDRDIAAELEIKEASVRSRLTRARQRLQDILMEAHKNDQAIG